MANQAYPLHWMTNQSLQKASCLQGLMQNSKVKALQNTTVTIKPAKAGAIIDFKGTVMKKVIIDGTNVKEIRGAENIQDIEFINGADPAKIIFTNSKGEPIAVPSFQVENKAPVVKKTIPNQTVKAGETISILLTDHFSDPENDELTFTATKGTVERSYIKTNT